MGEMRLIFIHGLAAAGKLTVARALAARTGLPVFHNHLIVDAVGAVFPFGSASFISLREALWLQVIGEAARTGRSLIFTFAPEPTVDPGFPDRVRTLVETAGGEALFVALTIDPEEQERRLVAQDRAAFGKLRSLDLLRQLRAEFDRCVAAMPPADLTLDTTSVSPEANAGRIAQRMAS